MKTKKQIQEKLEELKTNLKLILDRTDNTVMIARIKGQIDILEWVLE